MSASGDIPRCPVCLSPCRTDQRYCLECGARLGAAPARRTPRLALPASRPSGSALAALAVVAVVGILAAWGIARGGDDDPARTTAGSSARSTASSAATAAGSGAASTGATTDGLGATVPPSTTFDLPTTGVEQPSTADQPPTTFETPTTQEAPATTDEQPATTEEQPPPPLDPEDAWVDDGSWAVILISREFGTVDADDMAALESRARGRGVRRVGTLLSDNWSTLNPGYWVLFQGPFDSEGAARAAAKAAQGKGYPGAYPRRVAS